METVELRFSDGTWLQRGRFGWAVADDRPATKSDLMELGFVVPQQMCQYDDAFGWWFTGLTDGEGCFYANLHRPKGKKPVLHTRFAIALREDDRATLEMIHDIFQGAGRFETLKSGVSRPVLRWTLGSYQELAGLIIPHFIKYPLQSKKARDFQIWRDIVEMRRDYPPGVRRSIVDDHYDTLVALVTQLRSGRRA